MDTETEIIAKADAAVFRLLQNGNRTERRLLSAERTKAGAALRVAAVTRLRRARASHDDAAARRRLQRELDLAWGPVMRVRLAPEERRANFAEARRRRAEMKQSTSRRAIRAYRAPLKDARGRVALFFRVRYAGLKSKNWRPGLAADHALYILREEAQENGNVTLDVMPILSNMGDTAEEIAACWKVLEAAEEGYRANAIVQYRIIWNLPHDLNAEQRRELVEDFCTRTFGRLGLPWTAALHEPDQRGDQRNYHAHLIFSTRPCERVGDHQWEIAQEKVNGLTDPDGLKLMRALAAGHMNLACRESGLDARYTHQSYQERGLDAERQEHVGAKRMAAHESGESVAVIERNALIVERNEAAAECARVARELARFTRLTELTQRSLELLSMQRRIAKVKDAVASIATAAQAIAVRCATKRPSLDAVAAVTRIAQSPGGLSQTHATNPDVSHFNRTSVAGLAEASRNVAMRLKEQEGQRGVLATLREQLSATQKRVADHHAAKRDIAKALVMNAAQPPYVLVGNRVELNLDAMEREEVALIRSLDRDVLVATLKERFERDRQREVQAQARVEEEHRLAAAQHELVVAEACRILREAQVRPYRHLANGVQLDWSVLNEHERKGVSAISVDEPAVRQALADRVTQDQAADRLEDLVTILAIERHYVRLVEGRFVIGDDLLARSGVSIGQVEGQEAQRICQDIAGRQSKEVARIKEHLEAHAEQLEQVNGRWTLRGAAPADVRRLIDIWSADATMQKALAPVAAWAASARDDALPQRSAVAESEANPVRLPISNSNEPIPDDRATTRPTDPEPRRRRWHPGMSGGKGLGD